MDTLFLVGQVVAILALAYGCYLCLANSHLSDEESIEPEFGAAPVLQPPVRRYDPADDPQIASHPVSGST